MPNSVIDDMERKQALMGMMASKIPMGGRSTPVAPGGGPQVAPQRGAASKYSLPETPEQRIKRYLLGATTYGTVPGKGIIPITQFGKFGENIARIRDVTTGQPAVGIDPQRLTPEQMEEINAYVEEIQRAQANNGL